MLPRWRPWVPACLTLAGFLPLLVWHIGQLLERPHYQFVLFLPVAFWMLATSLPEKQGRGASKLDPWVAGVLLAGSACGLIVASVFWSPWVAVVAFMIAAFATLLFWGGRETLWQWFSVWFFGWILVPLPFGLDEDLIVRLRNITTRVSSHVLDLMGIMHQAYANVIELPGKSLFIADACSGIHSLYVLIAVALFVALWNRRGVLHTSGLLVSTFLLVLVENVARIVAVAFGWTRGTDLSLGTSHLLLGLILFAISACLVFSIDQFLFFFLPESISGLVRKAWNSAHGINDRNDERKRALNNPSAVLIESSMSWSILASVFPILGVLQLAILPAEAPQVLAAFDAQLELPEFGQDELPQSINGFSCEKYEIIRRVEGDPFGLESQQWTFRKGNLTASVYLDYPYSQTHDLCECYSQIGWQIVEPGVLKAGTASIGNLSVELKESIAKAKLSREFYGDAVILFSQFDLSGNHIAAVKVEIRGSVEDRIVRRWRSEQQSKEVEKTPLNPVNPPFVQIQLFATGFDSENEEQQLVDLLGLYEILRNDLRSKVLKTVPDRRIPGGGQ
jgi:exosortase